MKTPIDLIYAGSCCDHYEPSTYRQSLPEMRLLMFLEAFNDSSRCSRQVNYSSSWKFDSPLIAFAPCADHVLILNAPRRLQGTTSIVLDFIYTLIRHASNFHPKSFIDLVSIVLVVSQVEVVILSVSNSDEYCDGVDDS